MPNIDERIVVKSHVGRDVIQTAGLFKNERAVVWEYVVNALQYIDPATNPVVRVTLEPRRKRITIADNGRGMDWVGLRDFFVMHGENVDRKSGKPGRGRFGTGKSAAFGIADLLRITTVRNGKLCKVELTRDDVLAVTTGEEIPVKIIERDTRINSANGTVIEIERIHLRSLDQVGIIHYIERHLSKWPKNATVFVNNHECEVTEPPVSFERRFTPTADAKQALGNVELVVKVSKSPLDDDLRGVSIYSNGVWHETTLAGSEGREMSQYIFGEIDVPKLDDDTSSPSPFDVSRSMELNPSNELVRTIYSFICQSVEQVRRELVDAERQRKATEEAKRLAKQAAEIAKVINEDFADFRDRVTKAKAKAAGAVDVSGPRDSSGTDATDMLFGSQVPAEITSATGGPGSQGGGGGNGIEPRKLMPKVEAAGTEAMHRGRPAGGIGHHAKPRGGFQVRFDRMGVESDRAKYQRDERTIYVNLDHPQLSAAIGAGRDDDPIFRHLACEVAFCEYAIALTTELAQMEGYFNDAIDGVVDLRETLNRIARKGAHLYAVSAPS